MNPEELLALLEEGLANERISPALAAFIAADVLGVEPSETGFEERLELELLELTA